MTDYRVFVLDCVGRNRPSFDLVCPNDGEALAAAQRNLPEGSQAEIWHRARHVGAVTGSTPAPVRRQPWWRRLTRH